MGNKTLIRRIYNRLIHRFARALPGSTSVRPLLHRFRGVKIGKNVFIGDDVYIENEYPERVMIGDNVQIALRSLIIARLREPGKIIIEPDVYIGPGVLILCGTSQTLTIGQGSVIGAASVITSNVSKQSFVKPSRPKVVAKVGKPFLKSTPYEEFLSNLSVPKR